MSVVTGQPWLTLWAIAAVCVAAWLLSLKLGQVSFVDSLWPLFFLFAATLYAWPLESLEPAALLLYVCVAVWSLRLATHITARNAGEGEDARYVEIRENNEPGFRFKSLYIVFGLQGVLAWIISIPLWPALSGPAPLGPLHVAAVALWLLGFGFEAIGDWQLQRFKSRRSDPGAVLDSGLWRYTRHPNYFGDACVWWSYWLFAVAAGAAWTVFAPLLMTWLLLKVSGVALMEKTIGERRPAYADYVRRTSAFLPMPPKPKEGES